MGYMDLSVVGSDTAADTASEMVSAMAKVLKKGLKERGGSFNTSDPVNVAMIFDEMILTSKEFQRSFAEELIDIAEQTVDLLQEEYNYAKNDNEWDDKENKQYHMKKYKHLLKRLNTFVENK